MVCPYCGSSNTVTGKKKTKCLDCFKSFKYHVSSDKPMTREDYVKFMALMKKATYGMFISRDRIGDDDNFKESDVVKED